MLEIDGSGGNERKRGEGVIRLSLTERTRLITMSKKIRFIKASKG